MAVLAEGAAADRDDIIYHEKLPVYNIDLNKCMIDLHIEGEDKENIMIFIDSFGNTIHKTE